MRQELMNYKRVLNRTLELSELQIADVSDSLKYTSSVQDIAECNIFYCNSSYSNRRFESS